MLVWLDIFSSFHKNLDFRKNKTVCFKNLLRKLCGWGCWVSCGHHTSVWILVFCLSVCPDGFQAIAGGCYQIMTNQENWYDSRDNCEDINAYLARIGSAKEQDALVAETQ